MPAWIQEWSKCLWTRRYRGSGSSFVNIVPISKIWLRLVAWFSKVRRLGSFENQVSEHGFRSSSSLRLHYHAEPLKVQTWSAAVAPVFQVRLLGARSGPITASVFLECSFQLGFHPEGAQLQTPRPACNANQGAIGEGSFKSVPDPKLNANIGAASRYSANKPRCRDQGLHGRSALDFSTHITGKKSLKQHILRRWGYFSWRRYHYTGKITRPVPDCLFSSTPH